jgi:hypothetical protein
MTVPARSRERQERILPGASGEQGPVDTGFQTFSLQNCKRITFCCFKQFMGHYYANLRKETNTILFQKVS